MTGIRRRGSSASPAARAGLVVLALAGGALAPPPAHAADVGAPRAYCAKVVNDDETRPIPPALIGRARKAFGIAASAPDDFIRASTMWRCMNGRALLCNVGANLPCGKADVARTSEGGDAFCAENPDSTVIPMAATGHDTVFNWKCRGKKAVADGPAAKVDARGFFAQYWKRL